MKKARLNIQGLFLNADAGFDTYKFRQLCSKNAIVDNVAHNKRNTKDGYGSENIFDELLYQARFVIERTNAWVDAFKNLLVRFDTCEKSWEAWNHIAFSLILIRKL